MESETCSRCGKPVAAEDGVVIHEVGEQPIVLCQVGCGGPFVHTDRSPPSDDDEFGPVARNPDEPLPLSGSVAPNKTEPDELGMDIDELLDPDETTTIKIDGRTIEVDADRMDAETIRQLREKMDDVERVIENMPIPRVET